MTESLAEVPAHLRLVPCAGSAKAGTEPEHIYNVRYGSGDAQRRLGWMSLAEARGRFPDSELQVMTGSHGLCPPCLDALDPNR